MTTSLMVMLERGYTLGFYSVRLNPRVGRSKVRLGDGVATLLLVTRVVMLFAPLRIFLVSGFGCLLLGALYGLYIAFSKGLGMPVGSAILVFFGALLVAIGLIADQISQMRLEKLGHLRVEYTEEEDAPPA